MLDPLPAYTLLLTDPVLLVATGARHLLSEAEVDLLAQAAPQPDGPLDVSDLPALLYLHTLGEGLATALYDHIVVDEAQDVAPLYYSVLRRFSRNGSLTILGDMAQGVYAHRGIGSWDEVRAAFDGLPYTYGEVRESYRSTHEIVVFANRLLELMAPAGSKPMLAEPFNRHGRPVLIRKLAQPGDLVPALAQSIAALRAEEFQNIAVIAKTPRLSAPSWPQALRGRPARRYWPVAPGGSTPAGCWCCRCIWPRVWSLRRCCWPGADEVNYPSAEFEGRLLYVAATRALHALEIYSVGAPSALLELAAG